MPFSVRQSVDHPVSLYAATKKANELMAHAYSHLYGLPVTGLRFFTVYGPWGRPDMALFKFTEAILAGRPIDVSTTARCGATSPTSTTSSKAWSGMLDRPAAPDPDWNGDASGPGDLAAPYRLYNIGNNQPVELLHLVEVLEEALGKKASGATCRCSPATCRAPMRTSMPCAAVGFRPSTPIETGVQRFVDWYMDWRLRND